MQSIKTATAFFREANGKRVSKTVSGIPTIEDTESMIEKVTRQLAEQGCEDIEVKTDRITFGRQFVMLPKIARESFGVLQVRSRDYTFTSQDSTAVYGEKKGATVEFGKLVKTYPNGMRVVFEILEA